jgi:hypothetical protein
LLLAFAGMMLLAGWSLVFASYWYYWPDARRKGISATDWFSREKKQDCGSNFSFAK